MLTESVLCKVNQKRRYGPRFIAGWGDKAMLTAEVEYGDDCGNGHNTFAITGEIVTPELRRRHDIQACGCLHDEIAKVFPELAPFIKWHLTSTDGPMHYIANTIYLAGDRDCWGCRKGDPRTFETAIRFGKNPILHRFPREARFVKFLQEASKIKQDQYDFEVLAYEHGPDAHGYKFGPKYTFGGYAEKWHECPFDSEQEALNFLKALQTCEPEFVTTPTAWGEGKERQLDAAREAACWPEATDEELTAPGLKERLQARAAGLQAEFRAAVESFGFTY